MVKKANTREAKKKQSNHACQLPASRIEYDAVLREMVDLLDLAKRTTVRAVNSVMTATYWEIGRRIAQFEQSQSRVEDYGKQVVANLSKDLTKRFGRGFGKSNLYQMRSFFMAYADIFQTPSGKSLEGSDSPNTSVQSGMVSVFSAPNSDAALAQLAIRFPLPWSHYVRLLKVEKLAARKFYETEALRGGWSVRQLDRQISTLFYERTLASRNKTAMLEKGAVAKEGEILTAEQQIKDPLVLEFLGLKDEYSESDLENSLIEHLESFLLELGGDFTFVGRQRRLRVDDQWYRIDLLFFHRRLRCLVVIDLKVGKFTHADAGQMLLYLGYAAEHWTQEGENPPVGLILCTEHNHAVARYTIDRVADEVLAAEYRLALPDEATLAAEIEKTQAMLEQRSLKMDNQKSEAEETAGSDGEVENE